MTPITIDDFIMAYGYTEALELSNLESPNNGNINEQRINNAINTAYEFVLSYDSLCQNPGKIAIRRAIKRLVLDISRYFLDSLQRREDVITNYENCISFLSLCVENKDGLVNLTEEEAIALGLNEANKSIISYKSGRRAFTDESLSKYRNQKLYFN